jgi:tetratricopeptide (TPR) repeat protein
MLQRVRADLAAGAFVQAQAHADAVLQTSPPPRVRATALMLAGDAAYGLGAYRTAANRYGEALRADQLPAEAARTGFALGWAQLRLGRVDQAQYTWVRVAQQFPADRGAPLALIRAAELAAQADNLAGAQKRLDQVLQEYPTAPEAEIARLSRSVVAVRAGRTQDAVGDLRMLALSGRPSLPQERRRLLDRLTPAGAFGGPERELLITHQGVGGPTIATGRPAAPESDMATAGTALERFAAPFLDGAGDPVTTPRVLHGLVFAAAEDKAWPEAQRLSGRLVDRFPGYPSAPDVLLWIAARATSAQQWPIARSSYEHVLALNRTAALTPPAQLNFAEALFRTDAPAQARVQLTRFLEVAPQGEDAPHALHLLAEVDEALERPAEALAAYDRLRRDYPRTEWTAESLLPHARLLQHAIGRQQEARALLEEAVQGTQGETRTEASFRLAQLLAANGEHQQAVDLYMSAAYGTGESSRWYRPSLLGAGRSLAALHRTLAAEAVYRNLLPPSPVGPLPRDGRPLRLKEKVEDPEIAAAAASGIADLLRGAGRNAEAVDMYLTAASLAPESDQAWRGLVGAIRSLVAIRDWKSAAAIYQRLLDSHGNSPEILAEARDALGPPRRDTSRRGVSTSR